MKYLDTYIYCAISTENRLEKNRKSTVVYQEACSIGGNFLLLATTGIFLSKPFISLSKIYKVVTDKYGFKKCTPLLK